MVAIDIIICPGDDQARAVAGEHTQRALYCSRQEARFQAGGGSRLGRRSSRRQGRTCRRGQRRAWQTRSWTWQTQRAACNHMADVEGQREESHRQSHGTTHHLAELDQTATR